MTWPCGPLPEEESGKNLGKLQRQNILVALEVVSMMLFTTLSEWTKVDVKAIIQEVCEDLKDQEKHAYCRVYVDWSRY